MSVCDVRGEDLSAFVDAELGILEHREIEAHLALCDACSATVRAWKRLGTLFEPFIDEPIEFTPPIRVPQYLRTVLVASVLMLFVIGAVLVGSLGGGEPGGLAGPGVPIASSVEPTPSRTREPERTNPPTPRPTEPAPTVIASEPIIGSGEGGPFTAGFVIDVVPVYADGTMGIVANLRNATSDPVSFDAPVESVFEVVIRDASGEEVVRRSVAETWSSETMTRTLRGDEALSENFEIDAPEAGEYTITIELPLEPSSFYTLPDPSPKSEPVEAFATEPVAFTVA